MSIYVFVLLLIVTNVSYDVSRVLWRDVQPCTVTCSVDVVLGRDELPAFLPQPASGWSQSPRWVSAGHSPAAVTSQCVGVSLNAYRLPLFPRIPRFPASCTQSHASLHCVTSCHAMSRLDRGHDVTRTAAVFTAVQPAVPTVPAINYPSHHWPRQTSLSSPSGPA